MPLTAYDGERQYQAPFIADEDWADLKQLKLTLSCGTRGIPRRSKLGTKHFYHYDLAARLVDTASRLLQMLDLPVPGGLQPPDRAPTNDPSDGVAVAVPEHPSIASDLFDSEVARLGESEDRVTQMVIRAHELPEVLHR